MATVGHTGKPTSLGTPGAQACLNALDKGNGAKVGLLQRCSGELGLKKPKHPGLEFNLLSIIDHLVNGEYYLPPGDKEELFALVREVASGYTIVGTTYEYNVKNQLTSRHNWVRDEKYGYTYDARGNMTSNGRTTFTWDSENRLIQAVFLDGEGVRYTYDALGRRSSRTTFNHVGKGEHTTHYVYQGNSWNVIRETDKNGNVIASYSYDLQGRPLTITYEGQTYWYIFNAHGDVVALADANGQVKARYEYDEWGRLMAMYDEFGRVREGYGTIGDVGTGPARPVIGKPTPGTGAGPGAEGAYALSSAEGYEDLPIEDNGEVLIQGLVGEPTDLVKVNPYRYAGYRYDRETQYYYLQARYYDARLGRFLSQDTWPGDPRQPLTLNRYIYALSNPVYYTDVAGRCPGDICANKDLRDLGYQGKPFLFPPVGPSTTRLPIAEEYRFIQFLFDIYDEDYGDPTKNRVRQFQQGHGIPVDSQVMIGPLTWVYLLERYAAWVAATDAHGTPHLLKQPSPRSSSAAQHVVDDDPYGLKHGYYAPGADAARPGMTREERELAVCRAAEQNDGSFYSSSIYDAPCKAVLMKHGTSEERAFLSLRMTEAALALEQSGQRPSVADANSAASASIPVGVTMYMSQGPSGSSSSGPVAITSTTRMTPGGTNSGSGVKSNASNSSPQRSSGSVSGDSAAVHARYAEKYGTRKVTVLPDGRIRYYGQPKPPRKPGRTVGTSYVKELDPSTGRTRGWMESYNAEGRVIQVHPKQVGSQNVDLPHYMFDDLGNYKGKW